MQAGLMTTSMGAFVAAASAYGLMLTVSSFVGSTTSAPIVIAAIATAIKPNAARGVEGS